MNGHEKSAAATVVPWWLFVVVLAAAAVGGLAYETGHIWLWAVALILALGVPRPWWRELRRRLAD